MRRSLLAALLVLVALPAGAVNDWGLSGACNDGALVQSGGIYCFDFNSALSPASTSFSVAARSALACLKPDDTTAGVPGGASPATAVVRFCPYGSTAAAANCIQACALAGCALTGLEGDPATQLSCVVLGPGSYRVDFPTLPDAGELGIFSVQGGE